MNRSGPTPATLLRGALAAALLACTLQATAAEGPLDFAFASAAAPRAENSAAGGRAWKFAEFSGLRLVPREAGGAPNAHPRTLAPEPLRQALAALNWVDRDGEKKPLFGAGELADLAPTLARAFAAATPEQDVLLLSTSRRDGNVLTIPLSITARLFVQDEALQIVVQEARADLFGPYRASGIVPKLAFGSRATASATTLQADGLTLRRRDWVALAAPAPAAPAPIVAPVAAPAPIVAPVAAPAPAPVRAATPAAPATAAVPAGTAATPPAAAPAPRVAATPPAPGTKRDDAYYDEQEQRLRGLARLRDRGLISEAEYQQKRREVLQGL
jgi:hypothetical protein